MPPLRHPLHPPFDAAIRRLVVPAAGGHQQVAHWARAPVAAPPACSVVLVHGLADNAGVWRGIAPELSRSADVYAPDLRGHGASSPAAPGPGLADDLAADLLALVGALGLQRPW